MWRRLVREAFLATTFQVVKVFVVSLKKALYNVVESLKIWNVVVSHASRIHVMRMVRYLGRSYVVKPLWPVTSYSEEGCMYLSKKILYLSPIQRWRQTSRNVVWDRCSVRLNCRFAAEQFGIVPLHRFSERRECVKYRSLKFCAAVLFGIGSLPCRACMFQRFRPRVEWVQTCITCIKDQTTAGSVRSQQNSRIMPLRNVMRLFCRGMAWQDMFVR